MKKEFIPYEQALALKEIGFNEPCLGWYLPEIVEKGNMPSVILGACITNWTKFGDRLSAPTFSQAFRWFREEYGVECFIKHFKPNDGYPNGYYCISNPNKYYSNSISDWCFTNFKSYEEAELECLKKLIEIVKNK